MTYKPSYYTQEIPLQHKNGERNVLLWNSRSSSSKLIDFKTWKYIKFGNNDSVDKKIIKNLIETKLIVDSNISQKDEIREIIKENLHAIEKNSSLYYVIQPSANCPFGCHYCGQVHSPKGLSEENQNLIVYKIERQLSTKQFTSLNISWFGAEPLSGIKIIKNLSPKLQDLAKKYGVNYGAKIVTNGLLLNKNVSRKLIYDYDINEIDITLDGTSEFHDLRRHLKTGGGTFEKIYNNILDLVKYKKKDTTISIRCNVDTRNKEGIEPLLKKFHKDNIHKDIYVYFAQIHSWGNNAHELAAEKEDFASWEIDWFIIMKELEFRILLLPKRKKQVCMAVNKNSELIDPFGNTFNCTEVSLVPSYEKEGTNIHRTGNLQKSAKDADKIKKNFGDFNNEILNNSIPCSTCKILPICGGACPKEWKEGRSPCPSIKFNLNERIILNWVSMSNI